MLIEIILSWHNLRIVLWVFESQGVNMHTSILILTLSTLLSVVGFVENIAYAQAVHYQELIYSASKMQDRTDGNVLDTFNYLLGREATHHLLDARTETQKLLETRQFKSWFDFRNRNQDYFKSDIALKPALVKHVSTHQEGLLAKLMMIRQAQFTVDLTYYIFKDDESGYALLNELKEALRRGVSVRFMIDSLGSINIKSPTHPELKALIDFARKNAGYMKNRKGQITNTKAQVEIVSFRSINPVQLVQGVARKLFRESVNTAFRFMGKADRVETVYINPNRRSHDKILITDQNFPELSIAIIGGRNISNNYYGIPKVDDSTYSDLEVIVKNDPQYVKDMNDNSITTNIADLYEQLYFHSGNRVINAGILRTLLGFNGQYKKMEEAALMINKSTEETQKLLGEDATKSNYGVRYLNEGFHSGAVDLTFTIDNVLRSIDRHKLDPLIQNQDKKFNINNISIQFEKYLAAEESHIILVSPYLWLSPQQVAKFKVWLGRDPKRKLTIITNSILTSDNLMAQTLVDAVLGPQLILDRSFIDPRDNKTYSYNEDQIKIFEYGKIDSTELGGTRPYGKLHAKGIYLESQNASAVTTFNADPRSQYLNSETGIVQFSRGHSLQVKNFFDELIRDSHEWGSEEYEAIREHEKLGTTKRKAAQHVNFIHKVFVKLKLDWLI